MSINARRKALASLTFSDVFAHDREALDEQQKQRLAALLMTVEHWPHNYTATYDMAGWLLAEAERVGWFIRIGELGYLPTRETA